MSRPLPEAELLEAVDMVSDWSSLRGARIFITGGTGFFGKWLLEVLGMANRRLDLKAQATVLSRDPMAFLQTVSHLQDQPWLRFQQGDITTFEVPSGCFTHLIHGAASSDARNYVKGPQAMRHSIVEGTRRVMETLSGQDSMRVLFLSSGAVYGPQPSGLTHIPEDYVLPTDTDDPSQAYARGKREAEKFISQACHSLGYTCPIARCFAFSGPYLPLDQHFAFGNFIRDAMQGGPIILKGDGSPFRSYLYASELAAWLWMLLIQGDSTTYHVGSDHALTIQELAETIADIEGVSVNRATKPDPDCPPSRYVPAITRIPEAFGLYQLVDLQKAIIRTLRWHRG